MVMVVVVMVMVIIIILIISISKTTVLAAKTSAIEDPERKAIY